MIHKRGNNKNLFIITLLLITIITFSTLTKAEETASNPDSGSESQESSDSQDSTSDSGDSSNTEEGTDSSDNSAEESSSDESSAEDTTSEGDTDESQEESSTPESDPNGAYYELDEDVEDVDVESLEDIADTEDTEEDTNSEEVGDESQIDNPDESLNENQDENEDNESENMEGQYYELDEETEEIIVNNTPINGNIVEVENNQSNTTDYYVELDAEDKINFNLDFSNIEQQEINFEEPVILSQTLILTNEDDYANEIKFNLWNYQEDLLEGITSVQIFYNGELISEQPIFTIDLDAYEEAEIKIVYEYPKVRKEITKTSQTIRDLLPAQAEIISSDIPMDTVTNEIYNIRIYHEGPIHYFDIDVPISEIDKENIKSVYFVELGEYLNMEDGVVVLPSFGSQEELQ